MSLNNKIVVGAAITGVLTNPEKFNVPVTPEQMADAAEQAYNAGATVVHCHFRSRKKDSVGCPYGSLNRLVISCPPSVIACRR